MFKFDDSNRLLDPNWFIQPLDCDRPQLAGSRCVECGVVLFPQREFCPACGRRGSMETVPLQRAGVLYAFSVAYVSPAGFEPPYAFGYVQLPEGPRLFARLVDCDEPENLSIGTPLQLALAPIRTDENNVQLWGYAFRPITCHCEERSDDCSAGKCREAISSSNESSDGFSAGQCREAISTSMEDQLCVK
jgi:uncharacterized protein